MESETGLFVLSINGNNSEVYSIFELKNGVLATGSGDNCIKLWAPEQGYKCVKMITGHKDYVNSMTQLKNGVLVMFSKDHIIKLWQIKI